MPEPESLSKTDFIKYLECPLHLWAELHGRLEIDPIAPFQRQLMAQGREDILFRTVLIAATVNIALNLVAVPAFGMLGAATVTVLTELLRLVLAQRHAAMLGVRAPGLQRHWKTALATVIMAAAVALGFRGSVVVAIGAGVVVYAIVLFAVHGIGRGTDGRLELQV